MLKKSAVPSHHNHSCLDRLVHSSDDDPGIRRLRCGKGFRYNHADGGRITQQDKNRIQALVIPPAWTDVWICTVANGHLQATGRDERGRKQYRYHSSWMTSQGETKFAMLPDFARGLSRLRQTIEADMRRRSLCREKVVATVIFLMDRLLLRVGNLNYARENKSYGITTLRNRHLKMEGSSVRFIFTGKSGKIWNLALTDRRIARIVRSVQELPGQQLFQYLDEARERRPVTSQDINDYLRATTNAEFTSKHFRTWAGTTLALEALRSVELPENAGAVKRALNAEIDKVAAALGNTRAVCRNSYIHPHVLNAWLDGQLVSQIQAATSIRILAPELDDAERRTLKWLLYTQTQSA
ncbi:DNA topoisomerase IB [Brucella sp. BE17]|uniref:DNA topoisomerase IB n=1 Tax=Brucella sp. BE17 TaxID=3142977 RepID=UPI0031B9D45F